MPSLAERETFTLLNLSDSASEELHNLDLVQPNRKQVKRKVKLKRRLRPTRSGKGAGDSDGGGGGDLNPLRLCQCGGSEQPSLCKLTGIILVLSCFGSLAYLSISLAGKVQKLETMVNRVDDASKTFPATILQIKTSMELLQTNETSLWSRLSAVETRLSDLETGLARLTGKPQEEDSVKQNLADFGGKLNEVQQTVDALKNSSLVNSEKVNNLSREILLLKNVSVSLHNGSAEQDHTVAGDKATGPQLDKLASLLTQTREEVAVAGSRLDLLTANFTVISDNTSDRLDLVAKDLTTIQGKLSVLEDDNKNVSSRLLSLDARVTSKMAALQTDLSQQMAALAKPAAKSVDGARVGPRDKRASTIN